METEFDIMFDIENDVYGYSHVSDLLNVAIDNDIIKQRGSYFKYGDNDELNLGQGKDNDI